MGRALTALLLLTSINGCILDMQDDPFKEGTGTVTGTITFKGLPVEGAKANWVGQSQTTPPSLTGPDGKFGLTEIPAGGSEIILRSESHNASLRTSVSVVARYTSKLGELVLEENPPFLVQLLDPDMQIADTKVRLKEIPGIEVFTGNDGYASLPAVPWKGCYTILVTHEYFEFREESICPEKWVEGIRVYPVIELGDIRDLRQQVHNAYKLLYKAQQLTSRCDATCMIPSDVMWEWTNLPCVWPVRYMHNGTDEDYFNMRLIANTMSQLSRFRAGEYANIIKCPLPESVQPECVPSEGVTMCRPKLHSASLIAELIHEGCAAFECLGIMATVPRTEDELTVISDCLGMELEPLGPDSYYVFLEFERLVERPRLAMVVTEDEHWYLHAVAELPVESEALCVSPAHNRPDLDFTFSLYELSFAPGETPAPGSIHSQLSWIIPK